MGRRVVVTGMGVVAPNGHGLDEFSNALFQGESGVQFHSRLGELNFGCRIAAVPKNLDQLAKAYFSEQQLFAIRSTGVLYAAIAAIDCWRDSGFVYPNVESLSTDYETGVIIGGSTNSALDLLGDFVVPTIQSGKVRSLGGSITQQVMTSAAPALVSGLLGLGGPSTYNSSACASGVEAILFGYHWICGGQVKRFLVGGTEAASHYLWGSFDSMRLLSRSYNEQPVRSPRPLSQSADGLVPGAGAGILMIEDLDTALARGAKIYAEILGGSLNSGGQRNGGSMTSASQEGVVRCVKQALGNSKVSAEEIDFINGHLTATQADPNEVENIALALNLPAKRFPLINSTKSMIGHTLGAAGAIESVASVLQLNRGFIHPSINCEDIHLRIEKFSDKIPQKGIKSDAQIALKVSFGFGDVNACVLFKKWNC